MHPASSCKGNGQVLKSVIKSLLVISLLQVTLFARDININKIIEEASKSNKKIFLFLHKTGCSYCNSMLEFTLDDDKVKALVKKDFSFTHINISEKDTVTYKEFRGSGKEFAKLVGHNFYPTSLFLDYDREIVYAVSGYQEEDDFLVTLKYIDSGAYKLMDIDDYIESIHFKKRTTD